MYASRCANTKSARRLRQSQKNDAGTSAITHGARTGSYNSVDWCSAGNQHEKSSGFDSVTVMSIKVIDLDSDIPTSKEQCTQLYHLSVLRPT